MVSRVKKGKLNEMKRDKALSGVQSTEKDEACKIMIDKRQKCARANGRNHERAFYGQVEWQETYMARVAKSEIKLTKVGSTAYRPCRQ